MAGQDAALAQFVREQHPRLVGTLGLYTGDLDLAEDLAAEALARVARDWGRIRSMESPGAYAHRISINLAHSWFRRRRAFARALTRRGPEDRVHRDPDAGVVLSVRDAVAELPDRQRACVVLHYLEGLSTPEVAVVLDVDPGTVRSNLHAARETLRQRLGDEVAIPDDEDATATKGGPR